MLPSVRIPLIHGTIERRILANYSVDAEVMARALPAPFRPQLHAGRAVAGICLIRLDGIRVGCMPRALGIRSENAAHRVAVEWDDAGEVRTGVYVPRRDTSSVLNALAGGRVFPGEHHRAHFEVQEDDTRFRVAMTSADGEASVEVDGSLTDALPAGSIFESLDQVSRFFEEGSLGYSATGDAGEYDGLELRTLEWKVEPLAVTRVVSSYFEEPRRFPAGSVRFDHALLMRDIPHEWHGRERLVC